MILAGIGIGAYTVIALVTMAVLLILWSSVFRSSPKIGKVALVAFVVVIGALWPFAALWVCVETLRYG